MKTIRITLRKGEAKATCIHHYRRNDSPEKSEWSGDRAAFRYEDRHLHFSGTLAALERNVAHQAALVGAQYEIEDLGGETKTWFDIVELEEP
jgi:hypothetical protein